MKAFRIQVPEIPEERQTPEVVELLLFAEQTLAFIEQQAEIIQELRDEIARLKGQAPKPNIRPSQLEKDKTKKKRKEAAKQRRRNKKREKTKGLKIHEEIRCPPEDIPEGSLLKDLQPFTVQGIKIEAYNVRYLLERWETPDGRYIVGNLPPEIQGHFSPTLKSFILYQYYHCHVTQPLLLEQLEEWGIQISAGQLSAILTEDKERFHQEKDEILSVGLQVSSFINVDDTGARHDGKNGYCTHVGNDLFAWFESTDSKSRINFLKLLRAGHDDYRIDDDALAYMESNSLPKSLLRNIREATKKHFLDDEQWQKHLNDLGIVHHRHVRIATEGALIGAVLAHGLPKSLVIVSDDAGQFHVFLHALCWIHAERTINKLIAPDELRRQALEKVRKQIWDFYDELKAYKAAPSKKEKDRLSTAFDDIFSQKSDYQLLNLALKRLFDNKRELLLVLQRPEIPLHNNLSENDIREYVKRRKISGSTRSARGRRCRDTFTSLKKTARKLHVSFWQFLLDRTSNLYLIPPLPQLIAQQANAP
jgi:hypothetical protein